MELQYNLDEVMLQKELYWQQRSRVDWLQARHRNPSYSHNKALVRFQRNVIKAIKEMLFTSTSYDTRFRSCQFINP